MPSTKKNIAASASLNSKANKPSASSRASISRNVSPEPGEKQDGKAHKRSRSGTWSLHSGVSKVDQLTYTQSRLLYLSSTSEEV